MIPKEIKKIKKYEKKFARHKYDGSKKPGFVIIPGSIPIMVSAPHSINQFREGQIKWADKFTGALALLLHDFTGCHVIYSSGYTGGDPNYDNLDINQYQTALIEYVKERNIPILIDLHGASSNRPYSVEMGTAPERDADNNVIGDPSPSLKGHYFVSKLIRLAFEYVFRQIENVAPKDVWMNTIFDAGSQNTVTKSVSQNSDTAAIQLEINGQYRDPNNPSLMLALINGLRITIDILSKVHWDTGYIDVFKLKQSKVPVPQDKVEFHIGSAPLFDGDMVEVKSYTGKTEHVHVKDKGEAKNGDNDENFIYFTNRLIHNVFSQEWSLSEDSSDAPTLEDVPILVSERSNSALSFQIGMTKALKLDRVYLSSKLYNRLLPFSKDNNFVVYNRLTDSRLFFNFTEETNYCDNPPVVPAEKVMLPRYFKQLLGYNTIPFDLIRKEEFEHLIFVIKKKLSLRIATIREKVSSSTDIKKDPIDKYLLVNNESYSDAITRIQKVGVNTFIDSTANIVWYHINKCYQFIDKTPFYQLIPEIEEDARTAAGDIFKRFGFYDTVEIIIIPKQQKKTSIFHKIHSWANSSVNWGLKKIIGKSEYLLTTCWTNETDDKNYVARLSPNMMSLLGISDNDKVVITYGVKTVNLRILTNPELSDYQIGIPANARTLLNMYSVNDVVIVSRDMRHTFKRNSQAQTIAILGTVLAVFQVIKQFWVGVILCLIFIPLIIYFSLNEERIKVK